MDGYSVTEAASVLGVPTERVWELLARGVLSGRPEGDTGMRVFLQPRPAPAPAAARDDPPRGNGSERGELSPFRELLTEFRNLTERYGQALLALGEARGEVASLRSRVDVLEARMDLRLPFGGAASEAWAGPPASPPAGTAAQPTHVDGDADVHDAQRTRRRGPRRATESFAEALARAQDPSTADLPSRPPSAPPAMSPDPLYASPTVEGGLPREALPAEIVPVADEEHGLFEGNEEEPDDWDREEDGGEATDELPPGPPDSGDGRPVLSDAPPSAETRAGADSPPIEFDEDRYTTSIESPDWLEAEIDVPAGAPPSPPDPAAPLSRAHPGDDEMDDVGLRELPGARELGHALAAWDVGTVPAESEGSNAPRPPAPHGSGRPLPQGPATRAYRRLRRIFPE